MRDLGQGKPAGQVRSGRLEREEDRAEGEAVNGVVG